MQARIMSMSYPTSVRLLAAALLALASAPAAADDAGNNGSEPQSFVAHFESVLEPLGPDLAGINLAVPQSAVNLDTFQAPIERARQFAAGIASYYGRRFHGRRTASGERFNMRALTAAHPTLPFGSQVRVTNPSNGRSVTVRINDRGPFAKNRIIDLSRAAAERLGLVRRGHARVELELLRR
jgi:rare lipoprotein A